MKTLILFCAGLLVGGELAFIMYLLKTPVGLRNQVLMKKILRKIEIAVILLFIAIFIWW